MSWFAFVLNVCLKILSRNCMPKPLACFPSLETLTNVYLLGLPGHMNMSPVFNREDLLPYRDSFELSALQSNILTGTLVLKAPCFLQQRDEIETIMDDGIVTSSNGGFHCFLVQWKGYP